MNRRLLAGSAILTMAVISAVEYRAHQRSAPWRHLTEIARETGVRSRDGRLSLSDVPLRRRGRRFRGSPPETDEDRKLRTAAAAVVASEATEHQKALAELLMDQPASATRRLRALVSRPTLDPSGTLKDYARARPTVSSAAWSDYALALTAAAEYDDAQLFFALAAADRAIDMDPANIPARFNRAVIVQRMGLRAAAAKAFEDYLRFDGSSGWADEARRRLPLLQGKSTEWWPDPPPVLEHAAAIGDYPRIVQTAMDSPEKARRWVEAEVLGRWGAAVVAGDDVSAATLLYLARTTGKSLRTFHREELLADTVETIDRATSDRPSLRRLAAAHAAYGEARAFLETNDVPQAMERLDDAGRLFERTGSPMILMVLHDRAAAAVDARDRDRAVDLLRELDRTPARYRVLRAKTDALQAMMFALDGQFEDALNRYRPASHQLGELGDHQHAFELYHRIALLLTILGRTTEVWDMHATALLAAVKMPTARPVEEALYAAAVDAIREQEWNLAHSLLRLVAEVDGGNPRLQAEALILSALAAKRAHMQQASMAELDAARKAVDTLADAGLRETVANDVRLVAALLMADDDPLRGANLLGTYLSVAEKRQQIIRTPEVFVERACLLYTARRPVEARIDLERAIEFIEQRRTSITDDVIRDSFLGKSGHAYDALADLLDREGDVAGMLATLDRGRARVVLDRIESRNAVSAPVSSKEVIALLPPRTAVLSYAVFANRVVLLVMTSDGAKRFAIRVTDAPETTVTAFTRAIEKRDDANALAHGRTLHELLIAPASRALAQVDSLVIVADGALAGLPFASLVQGDARFLVERYAVTVAPSVQAYASRRRNPVRHAPGRVLTVGNPRIDTVRYPSLASLAHAEEEARVIGAMYRQPVVLTAGDATKARVTDALRHCDVAHLATHGIANPKDARWSRLVLTPSAGDDALSATDVAAMDLRGTRIVVLAACKTGVAAKGYGYIQSLSAAFIAAGARNVLASSWNVEDDVTRAFSIAFHRSLLAGLTPAAAHRSAQLKMLRSGDRTLADPRAWAAMQLYGSGD